MRFERLSVEPGSPGESLGEGRTVSEDLANQANYQSSRQDQIDGFQVSDLPSQPLVLGGSVKVHQRSENHRFGVLM